jgi:hypothetical protein
MKVDPHRVRMGAAQGAMDALDLLDDTAIDLMAAMARTLDDLVTHLKAQGHTTRTITQALVGMTLGAALAPDRDPGGGQPS